jgi:phenylalanyl-tRNA synthetase alpha chain
VSAPVTLQQITDQLEALEQEAAADIAGASDAQQLEPWASCPAMNGP